MKNKSSNKPFIYALVLSFLIHVGAVFAGDITISYLNTVPFLKFSVQKPVEKKVALEFVDTSLPPQEKQIIKEAVKTKKISQFNQSAKSLNQDLGQDEAPELEGESIENSLIASKGNSLDSVVAPPPSQKQVEQKISEEQKKVEEKEEALKNELEKLKKEYERLKNVEANLTSDLEEREDLFGVRKVQLEQEKIIRQQPKQVQQDSVMRAKQANIMKNLGAQVDQIGKLTIETRENVLVPYLTKMRAKIFEQWFPFISLKFNSFNPSKVVVQYSILSDGSVPIVNVTYSEGDRLIRDFSQAAVKNAAPFDPIPLEIKEELQKETLSVSFSFKYD